MTGATDQPNPFPLTARLREQLAANMSALNVQCCDDPALIKAAVAIVITAAGASDEACVLLTLRSARLNRHAGQFALPGGRLDSDESEVEAALRELHEELGLQLCTADLLGRLDDYPTRSGFSISPLVFWAGQGAALRPDPTEVAEIYRIPLTELNGSGIPVLEAADHSEHPVLSARLPSVGHQMFAPTAAILYQFRQVALRREETRVAHFAQPRFAWK